MSSFSSNNQDNHQDNNQDNNRNNNQDNSQENYATSFNLIQEAYQRIHNYIHYTPVLTSIKINQLVNNKQLYFKCELFQKTGSFKARGALNSILKNNYHSVVTHSSGNHGQALAWAAQKVGIPSYIVMPNNAPICKQQGVIEYGGIIHFVEPTQAGREAGAKLVAEQTGASFVHPYDNPDVIAGQGTISIEFLEQVNDLDVIVIPLGGGGFCSGNAIAAKSIKPNIKIIGAEPANADDIYRSKLSGKREVNLTTPITLADGLKGNVGELTWPIIRDLVDDVITVTEEEIVSSMKIIWERLKVVIEPSAAVGLAAVLSDSFQSKWINNDENKEKSIEKIGIILCGGNVDLNQVGKIF